ncbi:unnamed protein product [Ilex paraguariensis]|uniref:BHLH domain-containing protein n=1 Tax=Ilex paraguariensis TaxID=185542 RepID=A0ABC8T804_9AQUA
MLPFQGYYGLQSLTNLHGLAEEPKSMKKQLDGGVLSNSSSGSKSPRKKSEESSKKHAIAEQKRRERINLHYNRLRQLFPHLSKSDKASVLTETVRHMKELRKKVANHGVLRQDRDRCCSGGSVSWPFFLPSENDEATVSYCEEDEGRMVKATVCCEDRPGLNRDLTEAIRSVRGRAVRAEMATIGGRTKAVVVVQWREEEGGGGVEEDVGTLKKSLKAVVDNRALGCSGLVDQVLPCTKWAMI